MNFHFSNLKIKDKESITITKCRDDFWVFVENNNQNKSWLDQVGQVICYDIDHFIVKTDNPYKFYFEYYYIFQ